jgi:hypothetical protein
MTDIRQHLPEILSSVRQYLTIAGTPESLREHLMKLLPASYGIGGGCLVAAQGQRSQMVDVVIYDTTIATTLPPTDPTYYELRRARFGGRGAICQCEAWSACTHQYG